MLRRIIRIDREKCDGCGLCVSACHEGAIGLADGKAALLRDDYCDGLGDCLPACPTGAISFEEREASEYNGEAVKNNSRQTGTDTLPCGCPGTQARALDRAEAPAEAPARATVSRLRQWPVQIKLVPANAPYFEDADLLVAADCAAYAHGNFHDGFMRGRITLIGCPKLDAVDYGEKLTAIIKSNSVKSVTVARMEVPCCGGIEFAAETAVQKSGKNLPLRVAVIGTDGSVRNCPEITCTFF